tara:strand:- start:77 stop:361 length:285 start_codon:yes stop_codon:yes gene_type:complete
MLLVGCLTVEALASPPLLHLKVDSNRAHLPLTQALLLLAGGLQDCPAFLDPVVLLDLLGLLVLPEQTEPTEPPEALGHKDLKDLKARLVGAEAL